MVKNKIEKELRALANPVKALDLARFFKTGQNQYGAGDVFLGIMVPQQRAVAKNNMDATLAEIQTLLNSKIHEFRLTALLVLILQYAGADCRPRRNYVDFYLKNTNNINNWDLVDLSAPKILGDYLLSRNRKLLLKLAHSGNLWERRIAIISTLAFIQENQFGDTIKIATILLNDSHDLIHKAVGWMLREVGKRNLETELEFLEEYSARLPRTMLRYAIEKFSESKRKKFLNKK
ncbi:DNA alkylation repair protein [Candidatus Falkowbacteria bacterium CG_4_10_14_0_2_um_filter_41_15]|uniref:DNA alkylation repair protein n=4 Tax=Candidatus Falkowiibacteriota TaxID=1752728 RepID=A0A2G9ZMK3_9BACT|nr:MAG: DNA alkylation repair protein [Candidatus Falkowbacteria bacterium CG1_02_41_21]PIP34331.1 MAG: DNA alkylation repair protein [Candidatus Falkowbacteria bacterium CG23_combo_of_CG06-09_8_20_14_all_41_10]PIZ11415.1 MAG: DNA alkylation repair protein [Candidatus Falkowbacteria bacterium CG_4_10_14_0_8_um_filter_41_36]PJA10329.1 MAG: DNA alkylation repair protein [Candidatus Falkowbacteria bacterium CG_4_10_14_0_2_um_filter_41_15]